MILSNAKEVALVGVKANKCPLATYSCPDSCVRTLLVAKRLPSLQPWKMTWTPCWESIQQLMSALTFPVVSKSRNKQRWWCPRNWSRWSVNNRNVLLRWSPNHLSATQPQVMQSRRPRQSWAAWVQWFQPKIITNKPLSNCSVLTLKIFARLFTTARQNLPQRLTNTLRATIDSSRRARTRSMSRSKQRRERSSCTLSS